jgi:hypothetical protein
LQCFVVIVGEVEDDMDEVANVLDAWGMMMKVDDGGNLVQQHGMVKIVVGIDPIRRVVLQAVGVCVVLRGIGVQVPKGGLGAYSGGALQSGAGAIGGDVAICSSDGGLVFSHLGLCHTRFPKRNQVHLICAPGSIYTHMIDKMSEISLTVFKMYRRV